MEKQKYGVRDFMVHAVEINIEVNRRKLVYKMESVNDYDAFNKAEESLRNAEKKILSMKGQEPTFQLIVDIGNLLKEVIKVEEDIKDL
ncbi:hypothetical protein [Bacillus ndiopicus]|uniref:hypothetical protein n=1 Tax=Bacillus ndiopicus TaxID=1347368 RepID=UPI0005A9D7D0|nr:hypothetical protein [Bacillus ndiopicus]